MSDGPTFARIDQESNNNNNTDDDRNNENIDPWATGNAQGGANNQDFTDTQIETWRERERRQRSVRSFMMFMLMLMLMDGDEQARINQRRQRQEKKAGGLRDTTQTSNNKHNRNTDNINSVETDMELYRARRTQDRSIEEIVLYGNHSRVNHLVNRNGGTDFDREIRAWAEEQRSRQTRAFYEQLLKDLVLEQPDGSYVKVFVASSSNNEAVHVANDPSKVLFDAVDKKLNYNNAEQQHADTDLKNAMKNFDEFLDSEQKVWHYPWNATGNYRGDWKIIDTVSQKEPYARDQKNADTPMTYPTKMLPPVEAEALLLEHLQNQGDSSMGVYVLPPGMELTHKPGRINANPINNNAAFALRGVKKTSSAWPLLEKISLTRTSGKVGFQLYSKAVPAMKELSLIDGYAKICDTNTVGYSTRRDILLRVHGVLIHSLGRLSLVANPRSEGRAALLVSDVVGSPSTNTTVEQNKKSETTTIDSVSGNEDGRRRLQELLSLAADQDENEQNINDSQIEEIRVQALNIFVLSDKSDNDLSSYQRIQTEADELGIVDLHKEYMLLQHQLEEQDDAVEGSTETTKKIEKERRLEEATSLEDATTNTVLEKNNVDGQSVIDEKQKVVDSSISDNIISNSIYSKRVIPFPFAWDDEQQSLQRWRVASMSPQDQSLEINAGSCEFEINLDVQEEKWTIRQWKKLMSKDAEHEYADRNLGTKFADSSIASTYKTGSGRDEKNLFQKSSGSSSSKAHKRASMEQAWVMSLNGTIVSPNCDFRASVNSTAIRTDWESTTGKAMNYSFYMMTTCLSQIMLLLRQLLHTQSESASARVSILCIGWQTVIDALLCLAHVYFCLAMQPLFTAFASVAFFKLLIFCVIEMKYMAIIIQARNSSNGENSAELLRRQIAMLHLRFYVALMGFCLGVFYCGDYQTLYVLVLYSFWVPQIIHNVVTEAKKSMHPYYICGMSLTRMVAPLYMFAYQKNFLKEVYPESPVNIFMCQLLVAWVGIQAGVLYAQSHFGARFFIPSQFLPPKYDYNRPIPAFLLPQDSRTTNLSEQLKKEREPPKTEIRPLVPNRDLGSRAGVARNRKEGKRIKGETVMTAETVTEVQRSSSAPCLECVICYNDIDTSDRTAYMIAPCNHIFHKECLIQWMEVKMECPICRQNLPAL